MTELEVLVRFLCVVFVFCMLLLGACLYAVYRCFREIDKRIDTIEDHMIWINRRKW